MVIFFLGMYLGRGFGKVAGGDKLSSLLDNFDCLWLYRLERLYNVGVEGVVLGEAGGCSCCAAHYQL